MTNESDKSQGVDVTGILERNAKNFGTTTDELLRRGGSLKAIQARNRSHREMRDDGMTFQAIGDVTGGRDHSTIMHNVGRDIAAGSEILEISKAELDLEIGQYLQENFPGVFLEDICEKNRNKRIVVPRQALTRHLFYDTGFNVVRIRDLLHRDHSTILYAINKPEDEMQLKIEAWKQSEEQKSKKAAEKTEKVQLDLKIKQQLEEEKERNSEMSAIIFTVVASTYQLEEDKIISRSNQKEVIWARHLIAYFSRQYTNLLLIEIAKTLNRSDHSIPINSIMRVEEKIEQDKYVKEEIELMRENILDLASASNKIIANSYNEAADTEILPSF
jgi:chromosomal replication initiation ATPase DnaA